MVYWKQVGHLFSIIQENLVVILALIKYLFTAFLYLFYSWAGLLAHTQTLYADINWITPLATKVQIQFKLVSMYLDVIFTSLYLIQVIYEMYIIFPQSGGFAPPYILNVSVKGQMNHCSSFNGICTASIETWEDIEYSLMLSSP